MEDITSLSGLLPKFLAELLVAIICGGLIGLERGRRHKAAGLRDNILICLGAVLFMKVSELVALAADAPANADPGRIAAQVVTGIGFLGAGAILHRREDVSGLTTAATIWVVAGIGLTIGAGYPLLAMLVTGVVLVTLTALHGVEAQLAKRPRPLTLYLTARQDSPDFRRHLEETLSKFGVKPDTFRAEPGPEGTKFTLKSPSEPQDVRELIGTLWTLPGVTEVEH